MSGGEPKDPILIDPTTETYTVPNGYVQAATIQGPLKEHKQNNQDRYKIDSLTSSNGKFQLGTLLTLCDGSGGSADGAAAAERGVKGINTAIQEVIQNLPPEIQEKINSGKELNSEDSVSIRDKIKNSIFNFHVTQVNRSGYCTLVTSFVLPSGQYFTFNIGDSREYRITPNSIFLETEDHNQFWYLGHDKTLSGELTYAQDHPEQLKLKSNLFYALGMGSRDFSLKKDTITFHYGELDDGDQLFLSTDGLHSNPLVFSADTIAEAARNHDLNSMLKARQAKGLEDDTTALQFQFKKHKQNGKSPTLEQLANDVVLFTNRKILQRVKNFLKIDYTVTVGGMKPFERYMKKLDIDHSDEQGKSLLTNILELAASFKYWGQEAITQMPQPDASNNWDPLNSFVEVIHVFAHKYVQMLEEGYSYSELLGPELPGKPMPPDEVRTGESTVVSQARMHAKTYTLLLLKIMHDLHNEVPVTINKEDFKRVYNIHFSDDTRIQQFLEDDNFWHNDE
ncbi:hypothetical protein KC717_00735 [Candidatus Dojkabacteria bacterium]|uniref:PPM-type phosphatase domain-containing protein n=1 Tax=Candidatus Dojkabacteria bacterium TaxID=2099670 RepID=A0A955L7V3_9BACT|nr:hypothetical protein [Candidatus Dojkabacteria bacterium]